jgi:hypothetical protein
MSLFDSPTDAFEKIIHSEHKNFILVIILLTAIKFFILSIFLQTYITGDKLSFTSLFTQILVFVFFFYVLLIAFSLLFTFLNSLFKLNTRFRDNFSISVYSLIPYIVGLILIFPVELVVFGQYLFSINPGPFQLKPAPAYMLLAIEGIITLWAVLLNGIAIFTQTRNKIYSVVMDMIFYGFIFGYLYFFWKI